MSFNYDFTREDGTEVLVCYHLRGDGHFDNQFEVEFEKVYGLPDGEELTEQECEKIENEILANPPSVED